VVYKPNTKKGIIRAPLYSRSKFGRDAEITIALHIMSKGWDVKFSRGSRGPADLYASKESEEWYIQVKASTKAPTIKGLDILKLEKFALSAGACPVLALLQPSINSRPVLSPAVSERPVGQEGDYGSVNLLQQFFLSFYNLVNWSKLEP
jgi:Holliday junction resolvase